MLHAEATEGQTQADYQIHQRNEQPLCCNWEKNVSPTVTMTSSQEEAKHFPEMGKDNAG